MESTDIPTLMYDWARDLPPKVINKISPSQLGGCMREHFYSIRQAPVTTPTNPGYIINMQSGFMWEQHISNSLRHAQIPFIEQWKISSKKYNMEGTLDFGLVYPTGELEIWDSKTESSLAKKFRGGSYFESHPEYVHQINCYAIMAREHGWTVTRGGFVVIRRDDSYVENHPMAFDELRIQETIERINTLQKHLDDNTLPPCDGKFCNANGTIGLCRYGNPETRQENKKGKLVNTECCPEPLVLKSWADKLEEAKNAASN